MEFIVKCWLSVGEKEWYASGPSKTRGMGGLKQKRLGGAYMGGSSDRVRYKNHYHDVVQRDVPVPGKKTRLFHWSKKS